LARKISTIIGINGEKEYREACSQIGASLKLLGSEMKVVTNAYADNDKSASSLTSRQKILTQTYEEQAKKTAAIEKVLNALKASGNASTAEIMKIETALNNSHAEMLQTENDLKQIDAELKNTGKSTADIDAKFKKLGDAAKVLGAALAAGTVAILGASLKVGMDFEAAMSNVAATMGKSSSEIQDLSDIAKKMGASTKFSATQAAEALNYLALAGYDSKKAIEALPGILQLAAAGGMDLASTSDMVTDAMSALGLQTQDLTMFNDQLAKTSQKSNTTVAMLGQALLTVGGTAQNLSGGLTEANVIIGLLADNGIKSAESGTHLRNMILSLSAPTDTAATALKKLNIQTKDSNGNLLPLRDIIAKLKTSLDGLGTAEKAEIISKIFNKTDLSSVTALLGTADERWEQLTNDIVNSGGAAAQMAFEMENNLRGMLTAIGSALEGLGIQLYEKMEAPLKRAAAAALEGLNLVAESMKNGELSAALDNMGAGFGRLVEAAVSLAIDALPVVINVLSGFVNALSAAIDIVDTFSPLITAVGVAFVTWKVISELQTGLAMLEQGISLVSGAMTTMLANPVALTIAAITGAVVLGVTAWNSYKEAQEEAYQEFIHSGERVQELAWQIQELTDKQNTIAELKNRFIDLTAEIESGRLPVEELAAKQEELTTVQQSLVDLSGGLVSGLEKEKGAFLDSVSAVEKLVGSEKELAMARMKNELSKNTLESLQMEKKRLEESTEARRQAIIEQVEYETSLRHLMAAHELLKQAFYDGELAEASFYEQTRALIEQANELSPGLDFAGVGMLGISERANEAAASVTNLSSKLAEEEADLLAASENVEIYKQTQEQLAILTGEAVVAVAEETEAINESTDAMDEAAVSITSLLEAMGMSGNEYISLSEKAAELAEKYEASQAQMTESLTLEAAKRELTVKQYEEVLKRDEEVHKQYVSNMTEMFAKLDTGQATSIKNMIANLEKNREVMENWRANLDSLYESASKGIIPVELVKQLEEMGVKGAKQVELLAKTSDDKLKELAESYTKNLESANKIAADHSEATKLLGESAGKNYVDEASKAMGELSDAVSDEVDKAVKTVESKGDALEPAGKQLAQGLANGIDKSAHLAVTAANNMADAVTIASKTKFASHSPSKVFEEIGRFVNEGLAAGIDKNKAKAVKAAEKMSKDVFQRAESWINEYRTLENYSAKEEMKLWQDLTKQYTLQVNERVKVDKKVAELKKAIDKESFEASKNWIEKQKHNQLLSIEEELAAWERVQARYAEGTELREKADDAFFKAREHAMKEQEALFKEQEKLLDEMEKAEQKYADAVDKRAEAIYNTFGLFDELKKAEDVAKDTLIKNLNDQVAELSSWAYQLDALAKKGIDEGLLEELRGMGPKANPQLKALNSMTESELTRYAELWSQKHRLARVQAIEELEGLRQETDKKIRELGEQARSSMEDNVIPIIKRSGEGMAEGIIEGFESRETDILTRISNMMARVVTQVNTDMEISSPSRVFARAGKFMAEGLGLGFTDEMTKVSSQLSQALPHELKDRGAVARDTASAAMRPTEIKVDMTGLFSGAVITIREESDIRRLAKEIAGLLPGIMSQANRGVGLVTV
jgi:TP901 family phage tail tape measure protein